MVVVLVERTEVKVKVGFLLWVALEKTAAAAAAKLLLLLGLRM